MVSSLLSRIILLIAGILYPAYASHKAVKTKNVKEYVRWMIYWIVLAFFLFFEVFADIFIAFWLPFYYELKILFIFWLISPATKGSRIMYKRFISPYLNQYEQVLDSYIESLWNTGYNVVRKITVQATDFIFEILLHVLQMGQMRFSTFFPHITDIAQQNAVIQAPHSQHESDLSVQDESGGEHFIIPAQSRVKKHQSRSQKNKRLEITDTSDSESAFEDLSSVQNRPLVLEGKDPQNRSRGRKKSEKHGQ